MNQKLKKNEELIDEDIYKPWMNEDEINLLKSYLKKDMIVFEWGCGGSTLEFSKFVKEYYSVEHDFEWYKLISKNIERNVKLYYVPPETSNLNWHPRFQEGTRNDFKSYIGQINIITSLDKTFDIIIIDGRARVDCAIEALPYISENTIIFIHDFDRDYYWKVLEYYEIIKIIDRLGVLKKRVNNKSILTNRKMLIDKFLIK